MKINKKEKEKLRGKQFKNIYIQIVETHAKCLLRQTSSLSTEMLN